MSKLPSIRLTLAEFNALPEYSASLPTGTTPGKRWKRGLYDKPFWDVGGKLTGWIIGEYGAPSDDGKTIAIHWRRPVIRLRTADLVVSA